MGSRDWLRGGTCLCGSPAWVGTAAWTPRRDGRAWRGAGAAARPGGATWGSTNGRVPLTAVACALVPKRWNQKSGPQARNTPSFLSSTLNLHDKQQRNKKCYKLKPRFPRRSSFKQPFAVFWVPAATAVVIRRRWTLTSWHHLADVLNCEDRQLLPSVDPDHAVAEAGHRQHGSSRRRASQLGRPGEQRCAG